MPGARAPSRCWPRAQEGYLARLFTRTIHTSGQLPMRLAISCMILVVVLAERLNIDLVLGAFIAGAVMRAALTSDQHEHMMARLDGIGSAFVVPIFFITSGVQLDVSALVSDWTALAMVPVYALLMLLVRGIPVMLMYGGVLSLTQRAALALHLGTQISLVVAITYIAVQRGLMPGGQAAALVGGGILTTILFPALSQRLMRRPAEAVHQPLRAGS